MLSSRCVSMTKKLSLPDESKNDLRFNSVYVDISQIVIGYATDHLKIPALGSCVGLVIYPKHLFGESRCAIMAHIMLPEFHKRKQKKKPIKKILPAKYSDKAIPCMIDKLRNLGFQPKTYEAKMVGGAKMFGKSSDTLDIGKENVRATKINLKKHSIPLVKEFTGGDRGMNVKFIVKDYELIVTPTGGTSLIL